VNPDALLKRVKEAERARLKLFFGFAPGVGKTFAMLESAQRLKARGVDVVVGIVETHGRAETAALLDGLEMLPRRTIEYRGRQTTEFDLERALTRKPAVLLLDELAHTNVEGSRHARRWHDVLELLDAGIDVHTTLNVQHVESLNDVVAQITGVQVRETVPDTLLARADAIEIIDLPADELLKRLAEGKVYLPEQARRAADHFFKRGNLLALRELALRRTAERVDLDVQAWRELHEIEDTWPAGERILLCVGPAPSSARLIRAAHRIAAGLRAPWFAACVSSPVNALNDADTRRVEEHLAFAESLGGEVVRLEGASVAHELLAWAREHNVTRLLLGKPTHTRWRDRLRGSLLDAVVRGSGDIDVLVISGDEDTEKRTPPQRERTSWRSYAGSLATVAVTTGIAFVLHRFANIPDPESLFLAGIMVVAAFFGRGPSLLAAGLSVAAYDVFFVPPYFTFAVADGRYVLTFALMFGVGVVISALTGRLRQQEAAARAREMTTSALLSLTRELAGATDVEGIARLLERHVIDTCGGTTSVLLVENARLRAPPSLTASELGVAEWTHEHQREAGLGTETLAGSTVRATPLGHGSGVLLWRPPDEDVIATRRGLVDGFAKQAGLALDRLRFSENARTSALKARTEELRSSLLSAVSHDLRTPLAVVTGAATTLRDDKALDDATREQLLDTIADEAERLERLVRNLLDMTRVQAGALRVHKEWVPVDELVGSARTRLTKQLEGRDVQLRAELDSLQIDPVLFEQVLFNLLDNAAKYTPAKSPLEINITRANTGARITISDRGPGVSPGDAEQLFDKFYRGEQHKVPGAGLGLAICRGIVEAHGGQIHVEARTGGGASFVIDLPLDGEPPTVPEEKDE
jgi:two-component system sensor histidine kinase KdpD